MKPIQRLFIFDRREMIILFFMGTLIALFTFTLGVHYGKKVGNRTWIASQTDSSVVHTSNDHVPNRQEIAEQSKGVQQALEESLNQELHDEVTRTGLKLDTPHQMHLPNHTKAETTHENRSIASVHESAEHSESSHHKTETEHESSATHSEIHQSVSHEKGTYTLQIGSFSTADEAQKQISELHHLDLKPYLREAEVHGKGKWYRLYLGGFPTREAAQHAGESFQSKNKIQSFIVTKTPG